MRTETGAGATSHVPSTNNKSIFNSNTSFSNRDVEKTSAPDDGVYSLIEVSLMNAQTVVRIMFWHICSPCLSTDCIFRLWKSLEAFVGLENPQNKRQLGSFSTRFLTFLSISRKLLGRFQFSSYFCRALSVVFPTAVQNIPFFCCQMDRQNVQKGKEVASLPPPLFDNEHRHYLSFYAKQWVADRQNSSICARPRLM